MPAVSQSQRGLIFSKRNKYGTVENAPKKWKWVFEEGWENKGKLPKKKRKNKKRKNEGVISFHNYSLLEQASYNSSIKEAFDDLSAKIEEIEVRIRESQPRPGENGDDLDMKYRVLADNLQTCIRSFRKEYHM